LIFNIKEDSGLLSRNDEKNYLQIIDAQKSSDENSNLMSKRTTSGFQISTIIVSILGILFVFLGKALIFYEPLGGLLYMVIAVLLIGPFVKFIEQKFNMRSF